MYFNLELPRRLSGKNLPANAGDKGNAGSIPGQRRDCGEGSHIPLQDSCLENSIGRGAWWAIVLRLTESDRAAHMRASQFQQCILLRSFKNLYII